MSLEMSGCCAHKLDGKGRLVLPARFRNDLGDRVVATIKTGKWRCISVYPSEQWKVYFSWLDEVAAKGGKGRDIRRIILAFAHELEVDGARRILLPSPLRTYAAIDQEVSVNGNSNHIEIWNMSTWCEYLETELNGGLLEEIEGS